MTESGFGLAHIKGEGWPIHPDDLAGDITDAMYERQLRAYIAKVGAQAFTEGCVRDEILQRLKMEMCH